MDTVHALDARPAVSSTDAAEFTSLYRQHVAPVYRYLHARLGSREEAEDVTGAAFMRAWNAFATYRPARPFAPWLFTLVRRELADHLRKRRDRPPAPDVEPEDDEPGPEELAMRSEAGARLRQMLVRLKPDQQEALALRFAAELSFAEIAGVLGKREDAIKKTVYRALEELRRSYEHE